VRPAPEGAPHRFPIVNTYQSFLVLSTHTDWSIYFHLRCDNINEDAGTGVASSSDLTRKVTIVNELGLHARPAAKIAQIVRNAAATVWVVRGPEQVDASSIMELLTLACEKGTTLTFTAADPADRHILDALVQLVESGFEE